jgi:hypothetical protein
LRCSVPRVARSIPSCWGSQTCFVSNRSTLYESYATLLLYYPSWRPADVKEMVPRERTYWLQMGKWLIDQRESQMRTHSNA